MKNKISLITAVALLFASSMLAQEAKTRVDQMPSYPGCETGDISCTKRAMAEYVQERLEFPEKAKKAETGGVAMVTFVIEKNGSIGDVELKKDPGHGMGKEAVRVVKMMIADKIKFEPGRDEGKKVPVRMVLPVAFNMNADKEEKVVTEENLGDKVFSVVEEMPRFSGCADASVEDARNCTFNELIKYVQTNLKYPEVAAKAKTEGAVLTSFVIGKTGEIEDVQIGKGLSKECDAEALRVVKAMPKWVPGKQSGEKVRVQMMLPIQFKLSKTPDEAPKKNEGEGNDGNE